MYSINKYMVILNPARKCGLTTFDNVVNEAFSIKSLSRRVANFFLDKRLFDVGCLAQATGCVFIPRSNMAGQW